MTTHVSSRTAGLQFIFAGIGWRVEAGLRMVEFVMHECW